MSAQKHFSPKPDLTCSKFCRLQSEEFLGDHCGFADLFLSSKNNSQSYDQLVRVLDNQSQGSGFKTIKWFYGGLSHSSIRWRSNVQYVLIGNFSCFLEVVLVFGQGLIQTDVDVGIPILTSVCRFCPHIFRAPKLRKKNQPKKKSLNPGLNSFIKPTLPLKTSLER